MPGGMTPYTYANSSDIINTVSTMTLAKANATAQIPLPSIAAPVYTPEDFKAVGDGADHLLSASYPDLASAQVDYPEATKMSDQKDWCAWKRMLKTAGVLFVMALGNYVWNNDDLPHVVVGQSNQRIYGGQNSKIILKGDWRYPALAWCEAKGVTLEGVNIQQTALFVSTASQNSPYTPSQFNSLVGPIWTSGQSYRNINGLISLNGCDDFQLNGCKIDHATPSRTGVIFMGVSISPHTDFRPSERVNGAGNTIDACNFGVFGTGKDCVWTDTYSNSYCQLPVDTWQAGHLFYLSTYVANGSGNSNFKIIGVVDEGEYLPTDSGLVTGVSGNVITVDWGVEAIPSSFFDCAPLAFYGDAPPGGVVLERAYYLKNVAGTGSVRTFEVTPYRTASSGTNSVTSLSLTSSAGAACRVAPGFAGHSVANRYLNGGAIRDVISRRPHGAIITHNDRHFRGSDITSDNEIFAGASLLTGGTTKVQLPAGVVSGQGAGFVRRWFRVVSGTGRGQKARIIRQTGASGGTDGVNFIYFDRTLTTALDVTSGWEIGNPYSAQVGPIYITPAVSSDTGYDIRIVGIRCVGEFADNPLVHVSAQMSGGVPLLSRLVLEGDLDSDISRTGLQGAIQVNGIDIRANFDVWQRGAWPNSPRPLVQSYQGNSTGRVNVNLRGPTNTIGINPVASNDVRVHISSADGAPVQNANAGFYLATVGGGDMTSDPVQTRMPPGGAINVTGAGTYSTATLGRLKNLTKCSYKVTVSCMNAAESEHAEQEFVIVMKASGHVVKAKGSLDALSGTNITAITLAVAANGVMTGGFTAGAALGGIVLAYRADEHMINYV